MSACLPACLAYLPAYLSTYPPITQFCYLVQDDGLKAQVEKQQFEQGLDVLLVVDVRNQQDGSVVLATQASSHLGAYNYKPGHHI